MKLLKKTEIKDINREISNLSKEEQKKFNNLLTDVLYSRSWCSLNNIEYNNPDIKKAKEALYREKYNSKN